MKLQIKELKAFKSMASSIRTNTILPILSYLKFDNGIITKNNIESFIEMEADFSGTFLIDEKILMSFIESVSGKEIDIEVSGNSVVISNGKEKIKSPTDDVTNFPESIKGEGEEIELSSEIMEQIMIATNFTIDRDNMPFTQCVFIGNGLIAASTGFIAYTKTITEKLPEIIINKNASSSIKNFDSVFFSERDNYQIYTNGIFRMGFVKDDTKFVNMQPFSKLPDEGKIEIDKTEIVKFCDTCINTCPSRIVPANIENNKLTMVDTSYEINYEKPLSVDMPDFTFNPAFMSKLLKSVPDEKVSFVQDKNKYFVTGESGFVALIMDMK